MSDKDDERKRDEVLKRMLRTPPKPHKPKKDKGEGQEGDRGKPQSPGSEEGA